MSASGPKTKAYMKPHVHLHCKQPYQIKTFPSIGSLLRLQTVWSNVSAWHARHEYNVKIKAFSFPG